MEQKHLIVIVHGLWGTPSHVECIRESLANQFPESTSGIEILVPKRNSGFASSDGVKIGGTKVAQEIEEYIKNHETETIKYTKLSVIGYSLGGLWARYAIGLLYEKNILRGVGHDGTIEPILFTTFATPHVGTLFRGNKKRAKLFNFIGRTLLGQSGRDLFLVGTNSGSEVEKENLSILEQMADSTSCYYKALGLFKHLVLYANATNDYTVPFFTAYISKKDPFKDHKRVHIVYYTKPSDKEDGSNSSSSPTIAELDISNCRYHSEEIPERAITLEEQARSLGRSNEWISSRTKFYLTLCVVGPFIIPAALFGFGVTSIISDLRVQQWNNTHNASSAKPTWLQTLTGSTVDIPKVDAVSQDVLKGAYRLADMNSNDKYEDQDQVHGEKTKAKILVTAQSEPIDLQLFDPAIPDLNLDPHVVRMIESLNKLPWDKHIVRFHKISTHEEIVNSRHNADGPGKEHLKYWAQGLSSKL